METTNRHHAERREHMDATHAPAIKAAFFDIDGTLTSFTTHEVPESTIEALRALRRNGIKIFICSGRAPSYMGVVLDTVPVAFDGIVGLNGQYCTTDDGLDYQHPIDQTDVERITDWLDKHPDVIANYAESAYGYFNRTNETMERTWKSLGKTAPKIDIHEPHERIADHRTFQISPYVDERTEQEIVELCANVRGVRWHPAFTDLIPADGGKAAGMQVMLDHYGWNRNDTIAFGDGGNDVDMLRFAGIGIAMGNATEEPKNAADYTTDTVDDNGIANALRHFGII